MAKAHKIELSPDVIARVTKRRGGKLHAFDRLDPAKTALIVIDMQNVWGKLNLVRLGHFIVLCQRTERRTSRRVMSE